MNTSSSRKEASYLEDITTSAEYKFATANVHHVMSNDRITYFDAFNKMGEKIYKIDWTGREFFARRGNTDVAEYQERKNLYYSLFLSEEQENECADRIGFAEYPIIMALRAGELKAYYTNHYTGEETLLEPSFWRSHKCRFTRTTGHFKAPDRNKRPPVPGIDFIVVLDLKGFEHVLKTMPKREKLKKRPPSKEQVREARDTILAACTESNSLLNRLAYTLALNHVLNTDYFTDDNVKPYWKYDVPDSFKNTKRVSGVTYLSLNALSKPLSP